MTLGGEKARQNSTVEHEWGLFPDAASLVAFNDVLANQELCAQQQQLITCWQKPEQTDGQPALAMESQRQDPHWEQGLEIMI